MKQNILTSPTTAAAENTSQMLFLGGYLSSSRAEFQGYFGLYQEGRGKEIVLHGWKVFGLQKHPYGSKPLFPGN